MKDPPIGRIGYIINGAGLGSSTGLAREVRCNQCRCWFDPLKSSCPNCGVPRPGFNKWIRTAQLNNHLYQQAG